MNKQNQIRIILIAFLVLGCTVGLTMAAVPQSTIRTTAGGITTYVGHYMNATLGWYQGATERLDTLGNAVFTTVDTGQGAYELFGMDQNVLQASNVVFGSVTDSSLTSGRVQFSGASGLSADDADLTFSADTLTSTKIDATEYYLSSVNITDTMGATPTFTNITLTGPYLNGYNVDELRYSTLLDSYYPEVRTDKSGDVLIWEDFDSVEGNDVMESTTIESTVDGLFHRWYRTSTSTGIYSIMYARSIDGLNFTRYGGNPLSLPELTNPRFPFVIEYLNKYYMFAKNGASGSTYLYDVTDPVKPIIQNSGNPVITANYYNPSVAIVGSTWHMLLETPAAKLVYSYSDFSTLNFDTHISGTVIGGAGADSAGNSHLLYISERNALLAVHGYIDTTYWEIKASTASLADDLSLSASWTTSTALNIADANYHYADPDIFFPRLEAPNKTVIAVNYQQAVIYTYTSGRTKLQFYDDCVANTSITTNIYTSYATHQSDHYERWRIYPFSTGALWASTFVSDKTLKVTNDFVYNPTLVYDTTGYIIEIKAKRLAAGSRIQFAPRYVDKSNFARIWTDTSGSDGTVNYQEKIIGSFGGSTVITTTSPITDTNWHTFKIIVIGSLNLLYIDEIYQGSVTSTNAALIDENMNVAVGTDLGSAYYDDIVVSKYRTGVETSSGDTTLYNLTSSITVPHGLSYTPSAGDISITQTTNLSNCTQYWVDTIGAANFVIHVGDVTGEKFTLANIGFSWAVDRR